ncbi:integrase catalytic domain-containing protein, partial [Trichonephila clavipes]
SSIDWHFIPPSSPHFGGIWESGIRSVKFHLKRVLGETILTLEHSRGASFNLQPQRSLGVATEHQTVLLEEVELRIYLFLTTSQAMAGHTTKMKEDDIVFIKEEGPPGTWPMARVLQVHPFNDGLVPVATVKTQDSVLKRPGNLKWAEQFYWNGDRRSLSAEGTIALLPTIGLAEASRFAESGRGIGLGRSENKRPETRRS